MASIVARFAPHAELDPRFCQGPRIEKSLRGQLALQFQVGRLPWEGAGVFRTLNGRKRTEAFSPGRGISWLLG
jgi:hypothetical protein